MATPDFDDRLRSLLADYEWRQLCDALSFFQRSRKEPEPVSPQGPEPIPIPHTKESPRIVREDGYLIVGSVCIPVEED